MHLSRNVFATIKKIIGTTAISTTAESIAINGDSITVICMKGTLWLNPDATAVADDTALEVMEGTAVDLAVKKDLSIISNVTGADYQIIVWDL